MRILLQPLGNLVLEWIKLTYTLALDWPLRRSIQIFLDGLPAHLEMALDFANGPVFGPVKSMQVIDLVSRQHGSSCLSSRTGLQTRRMLFARRGCRISGRSKRFYYKYLGRS